MHRTLIFSSVILASLFVVACEEDDATNSNNANSNSSSENTDMPNDEMIKIMAGNTGKSESELRAQFQSCKDEGGKPIISGFGLPACEKETKDGGKACSKQSDCESLCLAETKTCATKTPMFGCFDVLTDSGENSTLCID